MYKELIGKRVKVVFHDGSFISVKTGTVNDTLDTFIILKTIDGLVYINPDKIDKIEEVKE